jgi:hypothetical protein
MKRIITILLSFILIVSLLPACSVTEIHTPKEQPHLYWKDIDVVITDITQDHWYTPFVHHYKVTVTVYSEEYNLTETLSAEGSGMIGAPKHWSARKGDIIKVVLYSWVMDSTGEIIKRKIQAFA